MNMVATIKRDARLPIRSATWPQMSEPITVPEIATKGHSATGHCPGAG